MWAREVVDYPQKLLISGPPFESGRVRMKITTTKYQWAVDLLFGLGLLLPIAYVAFIEPRPRVLGISVGIGVGYVLHITQKMLIFEEMLSKSVREEAEERVKEEARDVVEEEVEEQVESELKDQ